MKIFACAAALLLGTTAIAQQPSGETVSDPSQASGPRGVTQQGTDPDGQACAPAGFNQGSSVYPPCGGEMTAMPGADIRPCTKTVTDNCIQTYERGVRRSR